MSFRTVIITKRSKLSYKNHYMVVRDERLTKIFLDEIGVLIIDTTQVSLTSYLIVELMKRNIQVIFTDHEHMPSAGLYPFYGHHRTSQRVIQQVRWTDEYKAIVWRNIVKQKILNQSKVLKMSGFDQEAEMLIHYASDTKEGDVTNREGHAAKVYFNTLFGTDFNRDQTNDINSSLDYAYSILISAVSNEIIKCGCITQLGIHHHNEFNQFNLSCDLMEVFRPIFDQYIVNSIAKSDYVFNSKVKFELINILNQKYLYVGKQHYLKNIITKYVQDSIAMLNTDGQSRKSVEFLL